MNDFFYLRRNPLLLRLMGTSGDPNIAAALIKIV